MTARLAKRPGHQPSIEEPIDMFQLARLVGLRVLTACATRRELLGAGVLNRLARPRILRWGETEQRDGLTAFRASHAEVEHVLLVARVRLVPRVEAIQ